MTNEEKYYNIQYICILCVFERKIKKLIGEKYINPFTNFGFKRLFGDESNKDLLLDFLKDVIERYSFRC